MKNSKTKQIDRYAVKEVDLDEIELDVELDEVEEEEVELDWAVMENDSVDSAELEDDADGPEEEREAVDEGEFDTVAHYFRESARHKLLAPNTNAP